MIRVQETWGELLSLKLKWETIRYFWCEKIRKDSNDNNLRNMQNSRRRINSSANKMNIMIKRKTFKKSKIEKWDEKFCFGLVWFYVIPTIVGYLMPNPFLCIQTVLFQTIQFNISTQFNSIFPIYKNLSGAIAPD